MTTDDVTNLNLVLYRTFVYWGLCPPYPRPVSDDDIVDYFSCRRFGVFPIFSNFEKIEKKLTLPEVRFSRELKICKLYLYKLYYYKNLYFISQFFDKDSKNIILFYVPSVVF